MRRKNEFDETKLTQVATNKSVMSVYVDSFPIEKVKLRFAEFETAKDIIDVYISFEEALRIAQDIKSGRLFKQMQTSQRPVQVTFGGSMKDGQVESRSLTFGMMGEKIFINAQKGPGKTTDTGAIIPDGPPTKKVSVGMSADTFKEIFIYTEAGINAYLPELIKGLVAKAEENRSKWTA